MNDSAMLLAAPGEEEFELLNVPNHTGTPERRLILAVLERAILDFVGNDIRESSEAEQWLTESHVDGTAPEFSFEWVCQQLDLDLDSIRDVILRMPKRGKHRIAPWYFAREEVLRGAQEQSA